MKYLKIKYNTITLTPKLSENYQIMQIKLSLGK